MSDKQGAVRELFIEELAEVQGGASNDTLCRKYGICFDTTMACCEEGPHTCC